MRACRACAPKGCVRPGGRHLFTLADIRSVGPRHVHYLARQQLVGHRARSVVAASLNNEAGPGDSGEKQSRGEEESPGEQEASGGRTPPEDDFGLLDDVIPGIAVLIPSESQRDERLSGEGPNRAAPISSPRGACRRIKQLRRG